jgi:uncharacterized protein YndB with AHSA1/START domain
MGEASALDPEPGGRLRIGYPTGQVAAGQVVAVEPDRRIVFTWGTRATARRSRRLIDRGDHPRFRWVTGFWDPPPEGPGPAEAG